VSQGDIEKDYVWLVFGRIVKCINSAVSDTDNVVDLTDCLCEAFGDHPVVFNDHDLKASHKDLLIRVRAPESGR
jgi:hypothetical protein